MKPDTIVAFNIDSPKTKRVLLAPFKDYEYFKAYAKSKCQKADKDQVKFYNQFGFDKEIGGSVVIYSINGKVLWSSTDTV